jgi:hypothetical protein
MDSSPNHTILQFVEPFQQVFARGLASQLRGNTQTLTIVLSSRSRFGLGLWRGRIEDVLF